MKSMEPLRPKDLIAYLITSFNIPADRVNWGFQMKILNSLLSQYTIDEVKYALDYYKEQGKDIHSFGYLKFGMNMSKPLSMYTAEKYSQESDNSGERNRKRIEQYSKTKCGTDAPEYLFAES